LPEVNIERRLIDLDIKPERFNKRAQQALESKNRIFNSAIDLFNEIGFENVTIDNICKKAGVSIGLFYNYFNSKDQIIVEVYNTMDLDYERVYNELPEDVELFEKLLLMVNYIAVSTQTLGKSFLRIVYRRFLMLEKENVSLLNEDRPIYKFVNMFVEEGQQNGQITTEMSPQEIQFIILNVVRGVFFQWALYDGSFDLVPETEKAVSALIKGIRTN
jgi:AcrR family transcriptional regulator